MLCSSAGELPRDRSNNFRKINIHLEWIKSACLGLTETCKRASVFSIVALIASSDVYCQGTSGMFPSGDHQRHWAFTRLDLCEDPICYMIPFAIEVHRGKFQPWAHEQHPKWRRCLQTSPLKIMIWKSIHMSPQNPSEVDCFYYNEFYEDLCLFSETIPNSIS